MRGKGFWAKCAKYDGDYFRLEVQSVDVSDLQARFTAEDNDPFSAVTVTGTVRLKACGEKPDPYCG